MIKPLPSLSTGPQGVQGQKGDRGATGSEGSPGAFVAMVTDSSVHYYSTTDAHHRQ